MPLLQQHAGSEPYADQVLAGDGVVVQRLRLQLARIAPHFRIALVLGERGVGKEAIGRELHRLSPIADHPYCVQNLKEFAHGWEAPHERSTVFLRGLDAVEQQTQEKLWNRLLRLARETRVIVASEQDPKGMLATGRLRADLYAKVGILEIRVAPLRERPEDLHQLALAMLQRQGSSASLADTALAALARYRWPDNLHELWNIVGQVAHTTGEITADHLPSLDRLPANQVTVARLEEVMQRHVLDVLQLCAGNKLKTAELLGISRSTLYRMLDSSPL